MVIRHVDPAKQPYPSAKTQVADVKEKPLSTPNPTPAKLVNHPAKNSSHKPIEFRPTIDNSTNQKKLVNLKLHYLQQVKVETKLNPKKITRYF